MGVEPLYGPAPISYVRSMRPVPSGNLVPDIAHSLISSLLNAYHHARTLLLMKRQRASTGVYEPDGVIVDKLMIG